MDFSFVFKMYIVKEYCIVLSIVCTSDSESVSKLWRQTATRSSCVFINSAKATDQLIKYDWLT